MATLALARLTVNCSVLTLTCATAQPSAVNTKQAENIFTMNVIMKIRNWRRINWASVYYCTVVLHQFYYIILLMYGRYVLIRCKFRAAFNPPRHAALFRHSHHSRRILTAAAPPALRVSCKWRKLVGAIFHRSDHHNHNLPSWGFHLSTATFRHTHKRQICLWRLEVEKWVLYEFVGPTSFNLQV